jgi:hypothetical protein
LTGTNAEAAKNVPGVIRIKEVTPSQSFRTLARRSGNLRLLPLRVIAATLRRDALFVRIQKE